MNHTALIAKLIDLLETQPPLIPTAAWDTIPALETELETITAENPEDLANTIKKWAKPYEDLFAILRDQQLLNPRANPPENRKDKRTGVNDAGIVTNETLRRTIRTAKEKKSESTGG